jgi:hypothetical protein
VRCNGLAAVLRVGPALHLTLAAALLPLLFGTGC